MKALKEKLEKLAKEFDSADNELLVLAEDSGDENVVNGVAQALASISLFLKVCQAEVESKLAVTGGLTTNDLDELKIIADEFDSSGDPMLQKQASVLDQILLNFANLNYKSAEQYELERLRDKHREQINKPLYEDVSDVMKKEVNAVTDAAKAISKRFKTYRSLEAPLSTRHCPDHPGVQMFRVGDDVYCCGLDHKEYNYREGFTLLNGDKVPGADVSGQTQMDTENLASPMFDTREQRLNKD